MDSVVDHSETFVRAVFLFRNTLKCVRVLPLSVASDKELADVYEDRNVLALALLRSVQHRYETGYYYDPDESTEWSVVFARLPQGDVSWHVPVAELPDWMDFRPDVGREYDGYTRGEKNSRVRKYAEAGFVRGSELMR